MKYHVYGIGNALVDKEFEVSDEFLTENNIEKGLMTLIEKDQQETLLAGLKAREGYEGKSSVQTWLVGILKYKIIDYFRKTSREVTEVYEEGMMNNDSDYFDETGHWSVDFSSWSRPDKSIEQQQFMEVLQQCLNRLPPKMAQLFMLRELEGMNNEDICELMAISSINNLWVILSRTRVQLRHCLDIQWFNQ